MVGTEIEIRRPKRGRVRRHGGWPLNGGAGEQKTKKGKKGEENNNNTGCNNEEDSKI
jgi:hypothetical protein